MSLIDGLRYRLGALLHPERHARELAREMDFHLDLDAKEREHASGGRLSRRTAWLAARRRFGNPTYLREEARRMTTIEWLETIAQDVRYALRSFHRTPGFTAVVVVTLAVGIGANTAIFSAVHALLLRPLPFHEPDRLMEVSLTRPGIGAQSASDDIVWSYPKFVLFRNAQHVFSDLGVYSADPVTLAGDGAPAERINGEIIGGRYLETLGIQPLIGRPFLPDETERTGARPVVLLSSAVWQRRFGADPSVLGKLIEIDGKPHTVVGVLPPGFDGLSGQADVWMPIASEVPDDLTEGWDLSYRMIARRGPGVSVDRAVSAAKTIGARIDEATPYFLEREHWGATARPLDATRVDPRIRRSLLVLTGAVILVLIIACANVASLFLVRAARREREVAVRLAIGAGRWRLVRQLVTESVVLSVIGGILGILIGAGGVRVLDALNPASTLRARQLAGLGVVNFSTIRLDPTTLAFAVALTVVTGLMFGLAPALQATRPSLTQGLASTRQSRSFAHVTHASGRAVLSVIEIALAVVLLAGSGLMLRSLANLVAVDPGFDASHLLTLRVNVPADATDSSTAFYDRLSTRLGSIPGVSAVALASCPPLSGGCNGTWVTFPDRPPVDKALLPIVAVHWVTPGWFSLARVPILRGRDFGMSDAPGARRAVVVNESAARKLWPGQDPIGHPVRLGQGGFGTDTGWVVGVVRDIRYESLAVLPRPDIYLPYAQSPGRSVMIFLRTPGDPRSLAAPVQRAVRETAPQAPPYDIRTMDSRSGDATAQARFGTVLLALFAGIALSLATLGVYGVISFGVAARMREIGIRVALGATRRHVLGLAMREAVLLAALGTALGLVAAMATTRVLRSMLFDVTPSDPLTFAAAVGLLAATALVGAIIPARRAGRADPMVVLREE